MNKRKIPVFTDKSKSEPAGEIDVLDLNPITLKTLQKVNIEYAYTVDGRLIGVSDTGKEYGMSY